MVGHHYKVITLHTETEIFNSPDHRKVFFLGHSIFPFCFCEEPTWKIMYSTPSIVWLRNSPRPVSLASVYSSKGVSKFGQANTEALAKELKANYWKSGQIQRWGFFERKVNEEATVEKLGKNDVTKRTHLRSGRSVWDSWELCRRELGLIWEDVWFYLEIWRAIRDIR